MSTVRESWPMSDDLHPNRRELTERGNTPQQKIGWIHKQWMVASKYSSLLSPWFLYWDCLVSLFPRTPLSSSSLISPALLPPPPPTPLPHRQLSSMLFSKNFVELSWIFAHHYLHHPTLKTVTIWVWGFPFSNYQSFAPRYTRLCFVLASVHAYDSTVLHSNSSPVLNYSWSSLFLSLAPPPPIHTHKHQQQRRNISFTLMFCPSLPQIQTHTKTWRATNNEDEHPVLLQVCP